MGKHKTIADRYAAMTFWERLQAACHATGQLPPTKAELAEFLGIGRSAVTKYEQGGFPKRAHANKIGRRWKLRADWLLSGQGEMVAEELMDEADLEALRVWRSLPQDARDRIMAAMRYESSVAAAGSTARHKALTDEIIRDLDRKHGRRHSNKEN
jgi:transcriptional regulator with XRE-family HTH domain